MRGTPKWKLVTSASGREYAKYFGRTFNCCKRGSQPSDWLWIKEIERFVSPFAYGK